MVVKTYTVIIRYHVIRNGMYAELIMSEPKNNPKDTYDLFRNSGRFKVIDYVDTIKSTADQYELD